MKEFEFIARLTALRATGVLVVVKRLSIFAIANMAVIFASKWIHLTIIYLSKLYHHVNLVISYIFNTDPITNVAQLSMCLITVILGVMLVPSFLYWLIKRTLVPSFYYFVWATWLVIFTNDAMHY